MNSDKLILGTVQFGMTYGINNAAGKPARKDVFVMLDMARTAGISFLDSAEAYGDAHAIIGEYNRQSTRPFEVITKFPTAEKGMDLSARVKRYTDDLAVKSLWGIMFHSFDALKKNEHELPVLTTLKKSGIVSHVGVSVYTNAELEQAIAYAEIDFIQFPFNLLDNITQRGTLMRKAKKAGKIVHTRSAFLQGLFMKELNTYPDYLAPLKKYIDQLNNIARDDKRTLESLCLPYALNQPDIDQVIIGVDTSDQLNRNIEISGEILPASLRQRIDAINVNEVELLYPMNWK